PALNDRGLCRGNRFPESTSGGDIFSQVRSIIRVAKCNLSICQCGLTKDASGQVCLQVPCSRDMIKHLGAEPLGAQQQSGLYGTCFTCNASCELPDNLLLSIKTK